MSDAVTPKTFVMVKELEGRGAGPWACSIAGDGSPVPGERPPGAELGCQAASQIVRDLWRQKDLGAFEGQFEASVPRHGVVLVRLRPLR